MTTGEIRRAAVRLVQLGVLVSFRPDRMPRPRTWAAETTGGDRIVVTNDEAPMYLRGLAHGAWARDAFGPRAPLGDDRARL